MASDGTNLFVTTGNTFQTGGNWGGGEAIIRLQPGPIFTGQPSDYWAPTNWLSATMATPTSAAPALSWVDVPGRYPVSFGRRIGKDGYAYLTNREQPRWHQRASGLGYSRFKQLHYSSGGDLSNQLRELMLFFRASSSTTIAFKITATDPPGIATGWTISGQNGRSSPPSPRQTEPMIRSFGSSVPVVISACMVTTATQVRLFLPVAGLTN